MSKSKLTLIVDGNWLLMSRMSVLLNKYEDMKQLCKDLNILMIKSMNVVLRTFPQIDNIIFIADGGSWRNDLPIPEFLNEEYKGTRIKNEEIDWDTLFGSYENFILKLKTNGITTSKENGIEGDDWAWYWSTKLNAEGTNCIIWSKDRDLTQLVKTDNDGCFTVFWNKDNGMVCEDKNEEELNYLFNFNYSENETLFKSIENKCKEVERINPKHIVIDKIIRGDLGDNIIPIAYRKSKPGSDRKYRISAKDIDYDIDIHSDESIKNYVESILNSKTYAGKIDKPEKDIIEHFKYNVKLVELAQRNYPPEILGTMALYEDYRCSKDINDVEYQIVAEANSISSVLDTI